MPVSDAPNRNYAVSRAIADEFARSGVRHVCISPGSRSTPLALSLAEHRDLTPWVHIDERSGAFFALGLAKSSRAPVALVCTSGTAAANFYPAIIEAYHSGIPLLVLTADRPPELRGWGAGQTIDQVHLYGRHVRWYSEAAVPMRGVAGVRYARALASRMVSVASSDPSGPVHLNLPFREPLDPRTVPEDALPSNDVAVTGRADSEPYLRDAPPEPSAAADEFERWSDIVCQAENGVIAVGPLNATPSVSAAIASLAERLGWPLFAEPASQLRCGPHVATSPLIATADLLLRSPAFAERHVPDVIVRFGAPPTSKAFQHWLEAHPNTRTLSVDPNGNFDNPSHLASEFIRTRPEAFCNTLTLATKGQAPSRWLTEFRRADQAARSAIERATQAAPLFEATAVVELARHLPDNTRLIVSNSMPIRHVDMLWPSSTTPLRVFSQRGASGIDGLISSASGIAVDAAHPAILLTGDLAFLHDASGLISAQRLGVSLTIVVLDNNGGGIFSHLPLATTTDPTRFEALFRTPHSSDLQSLAAGIGANAVRVATLEHYRKALKTSLTAPGVSVIIVSCDADASLEHSRTIAQDVEKAIA